MTATTTSPRRTGRRQRRLPWVALVLLMALAVTMAGVFPFRQIIAQHRQVELTEAKLEALRAGNRTLEAEVERLRSSTEMERIARERLGLVMPGETAYTVTQPPGDTGSERGGGKQAEAVLPPPRSLLQQFWDFLTGRDLVRDG